MLVLSRKKNQSIIIDGNISIEILQVKGNTIRIGINAPNEVRVLRGELKPFGMVSEDSQSDGADNQGAPSDAVAATKPATSMTSIAGTVVAHAS